MLLNWRAWNRAVGTVNTAVTRLRLEHSVTLLAFIEPLTRIRWHDLSFGVAANGASQRGFKNDSAHEEPYSTILTDTSLKKLRRSNHITVRGRVTNLFTYDYDE
ncbi:hypothetical protein C8R34_13212 [Nitrosomonas sp. Nm84]|nr:hypothetical protein C8R34_13212 [Nitrosomonas sp. Nm84]